jgi:hypothetical protein
MKIDQKFINETVRRSVLIAYNEPTRQLNFQAVSPVNKKTAIKILEEAVPSYNDFEPRLLESLPDDCQIFLAREGSVCIYVVGNVPNTVRADEHDVEQTYKFGDNVREVTRLWWD